MNAERFQKLIEAVEQRPDDRFNMVAWARQTKCGTVCCAVGSYVEANPDCGLVIRFSENGYADLRLRGTNRCNMTAAAQHFNIREGQAFHLFSHAAYGSDDEDIDDPEYSPSKEEVLRRLKVFAKERAMHGEPRLIWN